MSRTNRVRHASLSLPSLYIMIITSSDNLSARESRREWPSSLGSLNRGNDGLHYSCEVLARVSLDLLLRITNARPINDTVEKLFLRSAWQKTLRFAERAIRRIKPKLIHGLHQRHLRSPYHQRFRSFSDLFNPGPRGRIIERHSIPIIHIAPQELKGMCQ
jgi:hypothetical protein